MRDIITPLFLGLAFFIPATSMAQATLFEGKSSDKPHRLNVAAVYERIADPGYVPDDQFRHDLSVEIPGFDEGYIHDMVILHGDLVVAGSFTSIGGVPANYIARWDGGG